MGVNFLKNYLNLVISKRGKSHNKVGVAEVIGWQHVLSKISKAQTNWTMTYQPVAVKIKHYHLDILKENYFYER